MSARRLLFAWLIVLSLLAVGSAGASEILLKYARFDPLVAEPVVPDNLRAVPTPGRSGYYILQFTGLVDSSWKDEVSALGAELLDYVPDFAFIVRMTPETAAKVRALAHVRWVGIYQPAYSISPRLADMSGTQKVTILLFPGEGVTGVSDEVRSSGGAVRSAAAGPGGGQIEATIPAAALTRIASRRGVAWIEPRVKHKLFNDVARTLMNVQPAWTTSGLFGAGEIVAISDTGLDTGNLSTISADFAGRVLKAYDLGRKKKWDDPNGHGTHVAGSVLGNGVLSGSTPVSHDYATSFAGAAPEAQLVFQSVMDNSGNLFGIPSDLNQLFQPPYDDGARVHTNSWGAAVAGAYTTDSRNVDLFTWNHPDMVILFSAGNEGVDANADGVVDLDSMGSPATAKNCITVGGSESLRLSGGAQGAYGDYWPTDYPLDPINSDYMSNDPSGMLAFSSRGPTDDGRIKPDIVAPGSNIISARSHVPGAGTLWGAYNADYTYSGGTSMSTPLTAGGAALVREYYRTQRGHTPSGALVKAALINAAADLYPGQYGTGAFREIPSTRPNNVEGWGLVDLGAITNPASPKLTEFVDNVQGISTGSSLVYPYTVTGSSDPVRVTLVWTDYPASTLASRAIVNDLDLTVSLPDGSTLPSGAADRLNNVEGVDVGSPAPGTYTVTVTGYNVPNGPQPFALVISADMAAQTPPTAAIAAPAEGAVLFGSVSIIGTASGEGFQEYVLEYGVGPSPSTWMPIGSPQNTPVTDGLLGTWDTSQLPNGTYTLRLTVAGTGGGATDQVAVEVLKTRVSEAKSSPDGALVTLTGKVVSAGPAELIGWIYVQELDRTSGIRVDLGTAQTEAAIGDLVTISGILQTVDGERVITNPTVVVTGSVLTP